MGAHTAYDRSFPGAVVYRRCRTLALGQPGCCHVEFAAYPVAYIYTQLNGTSHPMASILVIEGFPGANISFESRLMGTF